MYSIHYYAQYTMPAWLPNHYINNIIVKIIYNLTEDMVSLVTSMEYNLKKM